MSNTPLLVVDRLNAYYGSAHVLQDVSLEISLEPVALVGRNGMGKTTLCNAIMGLIPSSSGHITFEGVSLTNQQPYRIAQAGIGYVPQGRHIFPSLTVEEHLYMLDSSKKERRWNMQAVYDLFPRLWERRTSGAGKLSGGEQQMLAIGRALMLNAKLLIMDEPSEGLAPVLVDQLIETLKALSQENMGLFIVEQKLAVAAAVAERMLVMVNGRTALETTSSAMLADESAQRRYLGVSLLDQRANVSSHRFGDGLVKRNKKMATILIVGTFDTKGQEYKFCKDAVEARGHKTVTINAGIMGEPFFAPTVSAEEVAKAAGTTLKALRDAGDRGSAVVTMSKGATEIARKMLEEKKFDGVFSMGGTGGSSIAAAVMAAMPVGIPKVLISTAASGDVSPYVGVKDVTMMYSIVDVAGLNSISRQIFTNGVGAICGMVEQEMPAASGESKPLITATMYGVTTPCVTRVRENLEKEGYEVLVFHATGSGGRSMEALISAGYIKGVMDITTHENVDDLVQGIHGAGSERMKAAAASGTPQVISLGALDMGTYGPLASVPAAYKDRNLHVHNASITIMETTAEERVEAGKRMVEKLNKATGPSVLFIPLKGISMMDNVDMPFHSPESDKALFDVFRQGLDKKKVEIVEMDHHINDPEFADAMSARLIAMLTS